MGFFPHLPIRIPYSPGIAHWWDPFWWLFQIVVMATLLMVFRKVALHVDDQFDDSESQAFHRNEKPGSRSS